MNDISAPQLIAIVHDTLREVYHDEAFIKRTVDALNAKFTGVPDNLDQAYDIAITEVMHQISNHPSFHARIAKALGVPPDDIRVELHVVAMRMREFTDLQASPERAFQAHIDAAGHSHNVFTCGECQRLRARMKTGSARWN